MEAMIHGEVTEQPAPATTQKRRTLNGNGTVVSYLFFANCLYFSCVLLSSLSCFLVSHVASCFVDCFLMLSGYLDRVVCGGNRQRHHRRYPEPSFDACARMLAFLSSFRGKTDGRWFVLHHRTTRSTDRRSSTPRRSLLLLSQTATALIVPHVGITITSHTPSHDEMIGTFFAVLP
jgi:hypothetical protein